MTDNPFSTLDGTHLQTLQDSVADVAARVSPTPITSFSTSVRAASSALSAWHEARAALPPEAVPLVRRGLEATTTDALGHLVQLHQAIADHDLDARDPDVLTERLLFLDAQATDPTLEREARLGASAELLESLSSALAAFRKDVDVTKLCPALLRRAQQLQPLWEDILSALSEDADARHDINADSDGAKALVSAARDAGITLQKHVSWVQEHSKDAPFTPIGEEAYGAVLQARVLPDVDALEAQLTLELSSMLAEEARLRRRGFAGRTAQDLSDNPLSEAPRTHDEALAWMEELVELAHAFSLESQLFPMTTNDQVLVGVGFAHQALVAESALLRPPRRGADTQLSRLLLTPGPSRDDTPSALSSMKHLHLAELEAIATRRLSPGEHLFSMWANAADSVVASGALTGLHPLTQLFGEDAEQGWVLHAEELAREMQFRDSPAVRLVVLRRAIAAAVHALCDLRLHCRGLDAKQALARLMIDGRLTERFALNRLWASMRAPTTGLSAMWGRMTIHQHRREARALWRHSFTERRLNEFVLFHGRVPLALQHALLDAPTPFSSDEGTQEYELGEHPVG